MYPLHHDCRQTGTKWSDQLPKSYSHESQDRGLHRVCHVILLVPRNVPDRSLINRFDYRDQWSAAVAELARWVAEGKLKRRFTVVKGLDKAYDALNMLFTGGNTGKLCVSL